MTSTIIHVSKYSVRDPNVRYFMKHSCITDVRKMVIPCKYCSMYCKSDNGTIFEIIANLESMRLFGRVTAKYIYLTVKKILKWKFFLTVDRRLRGDGFFVNLNANNQKQTISLCFKGQHCSHCCPAEHLLETSAWLIITPESPCFLKCMLLNRKNTYGFMPFFSTVIFPSYTWNLEDSV
jgi:hypothetical protein